MEVEIMTVSCKGKELTAVLVIYSSNWIFCN